MEKILVAFDATATPELLFGAGYYVKELLIELDECKEIALKIITRKNDKNRFKEFAPNAEILNIAPDSKFLRIFFQIFQLGPIVDRLKVDLFHGPHYQTPKNMKTKSVVTIHDMTLLMHKDFHQGVKTKFFSKIIPASINRASAIIAVSQNTSDDIEKIFTKHSPIFVAPLGVDTKRFHTQKDESEKTLLEARGIASDYIAFLGLLEPRKSVPTLINAFTLIHDEFPNLKLVLAGSLGWGSKKIRESIVKSSAAGKIIAPGRLAESETGSFLRNALIFVYPSLYEGFGMPVLESMSCGTPTITTNSSSLREVAGNGALLFEPQDEKTLAALLTTLLKDQKLRDELSSKGLRRSKKFSWKNCASIHLEAYQKVAQLQ